MWVRYNYHGEKGKIDRELIVSSGEDPDRGIALVNRCIAEYAVIVGRNLKETREEVAAK